MRCSAPFVRSLVHVDLLGCSYFVLCPTLQRVALPTLLDVLSSFPFPNEAKEALQIFLTLSGTTTRRLPSCDFRPQYAVQNPRAAEATQPIQSSSGAGPSGVGEPRPILSKKAKMRHAIEATLRAHYGHTLQVSACIPLMSSLVFFSCVFSTIIWRRRSRRPSRSSTVARGTNCSSSSKSTAPKQSTWRPSRTMGYVSKLYRTCNGTAQMWDTFHFKFCYVLLDVLIIIRV